MTLFPKVDSWIFGANIPGKKKDVMFYLAGLGTTARSWRPRKRPDTPASPFRPPHSRSGHPA